MTLAVHRLEADELRAAHTLFAAAIHRPPANDAGWAASARLYSPGRTFGVHAGDMLVATATSFPSDLAVPGGAVLPMAAVTRVGVRADHTRRGLLTAMMRAQLDDTAARGEPVATLRASEARIYGRFGYGVATRGRSVRVRADATLFRPEAPRGAVRLLERGEIVPVLREIHARIALRRPGGITRTEGWWAVGTGRRVDVEREHVLAAVHTGQQGDDGFAIAYLADANGVSGRSLDVVDLHGDVGATASLWRFLMGVDLVESVQAHLRPLDEPMELLLADPRASVVTGNEDETWLRLVDVPVALAARSYGAAEPVLLAVHDGLLEANSGVYRIADGSAERVGPLGGQVRPELECTVDALAMAYLGDRRPSELVATGWWSAPDPEAVSRADAAFATAGTPWCGTYF
ncbi:GNAT family N-acetyltransferase [Pseudonocardia sp. DSM 110487]|uniref:GNAT family N-acetyltransferase n=1 Tax=Pseudonocardia sp. DSM 110487 TaxID=2865833 RepID=UPI001C6A2652|nr:GNAT family N-acetyltransferase [Pseudonocardia sp. DSM 110487]QYN40453.1 GNAT family N-acetyltransferase [Pseudonocardia sp. DSM 110487]